MRCVTLLACEGVRRRSSPGKRPGGPQPFDLRPLRGGAHRVRPRPPRAAGDRGARRRGDRESRPRRHGPVASRPGVVVAGPRVDRPAGHESQGAGSRDGDAARRAARTRTRRRRRSRRDRSPVVAVLPDGARAHRGRGVLGGDPTSGLRGDRLGRLRDLHRPGHRRVGRSVGRPRRWSGWSSPATVAPSGSCSVRCPGQPMLGVNVDYASISRVHVADGQPRLVSINETGHFDAEREAVRGPMGDGATIDDAFHRARTMRR